MPPQVMALGNSLLQSTPNPFFGIIANGPLAASTTTVGQLLLPYPQFTTLRDFRPNAASSIYHAFQARVTKRFSHGMQFLLSYAYAKSIDDSSNLVDDSGLGLAGAHQNFYNRHADRSVSLHDIPQNLVLSYILELPFGRRKSIGSGWGHLTDAILGGWQFNAIVACHSGMPLLIQNASNNSGSFSDVQRPNVSGDASLPADRSTQAHLAEWFNTTVFSQPAAFTFGDAPRALSNVRGDGLANLDTSFFKNFSLSKEGPAKVEFRTEFFNFLNSPQFAAPGSTFGSSSFGIVSAQANISRQIQFGLKIIF